MKAWIKDFLFGPEKYSIVMLEAREVTLPMPEQDYYVKAYRYMDSWKRPFWFTRTCSRIEIELPKKDRFPTPNGKGKMICFSDYADTIEEGIGQIVGNQLKLRLEAERGVVWN